MRPGEGRFGWKANAAGLDGRPRGGREQIPGESSDLRPDLLCAADEQLLPLVRRELAATGADPHNLVFEVTETAAISSIPEAQHFVSELKELGCRFALDDFGAGFSSFHQLKHRDVDYLKIDGSFIRDLVKSEVDQHLVRAMVELARALGKETIAEFVEDEETVALLRKLGVDYAQGYHVGEPKDLVSAIGEASAPRTLAA